MNYQLIDTVPEYPNNSPKDIILSGQKHGEVKRTPAGRWHAYFHAKADCYDSVFIQGIGESPEDAVRNAFIERREELLRHLVELNEAEEAMLGESRSVDILAAV